MKYSNIALKIVAAKECGFIKTNTQFWKAIEDKENFNKEILENTRVVNIAEKLSKEFDLIEDGGIICFYDKEFPVINKKVKNKGDKPYLLFYRGDLSLLQDLNKNIAVVGTLDIDNDIIKREIAVVKKLVKNNLVIVSGLAKGCDTLSHKVCLEKGGKTIAILPSNLSKIYPAQNRQFAEEIIEKGGLLISEYYRDSNSRNESINRFIQRDRLQAMFSKAIILIASYRKGEGDSGSRYAMEAAKKYEIERYVMFNSTTDKDNKQFGLNSDLVCNDNNEVKILQLGSIKTITSIENPNLLVNEEIYIGEQLHFYDE